jgi:DnaJ-domain-containing protein 1
MIVKLLIIAGLVFITLMCMKAILDHIMQTGDENSSRKVYEICRFIHEIGGSFIRKGRDYQDIGKVGRKTGMKDVVDGTVWEIGEKVYNNFSPEMHLKKKARDRIYEVLAVLEKAAENAEQKSSKDASDFVKECCEELGRIESGPLGDNPSSTFKRIEEIAGYAEQIATAESFNDSILQSSECMRDYYEILGVARNASPEEIKKAFRNLSKEYHPDKWPDLPDDMRKFAEERFKEINEAYSVLSDPEKRKDYDNLTFA